MSGRRPDNPSLFPELDEPEGPWAAENRLRQEGFVHVAGVDEAGRGPLAGPVVAAAVILDPKLEYPGVTDSKKLNAKLREKVFRLIVVHAVSVGLGWARPEEIDRINILQASLQAMARAVDTLRPRPDHLLVDGPHPASIDILQKTMPRGDARSISIGAASIVAKVIRDRMMLAYDRRFPGYGFSSHKGYGTKVHLEALSRLGPCPIHRLSFKGVCQGAPGNAEKGD